MRCSFFNQVARLQRGGEIIDYRTVLAPCSHIHSDQGESSTTGLEWSRIILPTLPKPTCSLAVIGSDLGSTVQQTHAVFLYIHISLTVDVSLKGSICICLAGPGGLAAGRFGGELGTWKVSTVYFGYRLLGYFPAFSSNLHKFTRDIYMLPMPACSSFLNRYFTESLLPTMVLNLLG